LDRAVASQKQGEQPHLHRELKALVEEGIVTDLLRLLLADRDLLSQVANASHTHYNHFDKIMLISSVDPEYYLRLHIWWPDDSKAADENIHDHKSEFSSVLLKGEYQFEEFLPVEEGNDFYEYKYLTRRGLNNYSMPFVGMTKLSCVFSGTLRAGNCYTLSPHVLHRVVNNPRELTASLMLQRHPVKSFARVMTEEPLVEQTDIDASPLTPEYLAEAIEKFLAHVEGRDATREGELQQVGAS
jgi:hypothetical protein